MIRSKLGSLFWFLVRPRFYPHLVRLLTVGQLTKRSALNRTRREASDWCADRAIDTDQALKQLIQGSPEKSLRAVFPDVFQKADESVAACPVPMGGAGDLDLLYHLAERCEATRVLETGVAYGWSSLALLLSIGHRPAGELVSTDLPYPGLGGERFVGCAVPAELREGWTLIRNADRQAIPAALKRLGTIDLCHYDSDKSYHGRMWAYGRLWRALRPGGFFLSDDVGDNVAFRDFVAQEGLDPIIIHFDGKYVGVIEKKL